MSFYFSIQDWMLDYKLTSSELLVYGYINSFSLKNVAEKLLTCQTIAYKLRISEKTCYRSLKRLMKLKLVICLPGENKSSKYYVTAKYTSGDKQRWAEKN